MDENTKLTGGQVKIKYRKLKLEQNRTERPNRTDWTEGRRDYLAIVGGVVTVLTLLRLVSLLSTSPSRGCAGVACGASTAARAAAPPLSYPCVRHNHWRRDDSSAHSHCYKHPRIVSFGDNHHEHELNDFTNKNDLKTQGFQINEAIHVSERFRLKEKILEINYSVNNNILLVSS